MHTACSSSVRCAATATLRQPSPSPPAKLATPHSQACPCHAGISPRRTFPHSTIPRRGTSAATGPSQRRGHYWGAAQPSGRDSPRAGHPPGSSSELDREAAGGPELDRQAPVNSQRHVLASGEVIEYKDSATDVLFIALVRKVGAGLPLLEGDSWS